MNIVLFHDHELVSPIPRADRRIQHVLTVLNKKQGDTFKAGVINTSIGHAVLTNITDSEVTVTYIPDGEPVPPLPLTLLLGFPRPIQAKRIFKDCTSLGIASIILTGTELGEKSYRESTFFKENEYVENLLEGAEQAGNPCIPHVSKYWSLQKALTNEKEQFFAAQKIVLHPENQNNGSSIACTSLGKLEIDPHIPIVLAIGSERGWTEHEVSLLEEHGFKRVGLGTRILRTETACTVALAILAAKLGYL